MAGQKMLVGLFNAIKVESVPLNSKFFRRGTARSIQQLPSIPVKRCRRACTHCQFKRDFSRSVHARRPEPRPGSLPYNVGYRSRVIEVLPLALVITVSPLSIIPGVLVLHAPHPRESGLAYLAGWVFGIAALTAIAIGISNMLGGLREQPPQWASWLRIVVGITLIVFGVLRWLTRRGHDHIPAWMRTLTSVTPPRAAMTGAALAVLNVKVLFVCAAAGLAIGTDALGVAGTVLTAAVFVAVATSSVVIPILAYTAAGGRLDDPLERLKNWMEKHNAAVVAVILVLIGLAVLYKGIHAL